MSRRRNPLFAHKRKILQDISSSDSEDPAMIPKKEKDDVEKELQQYKLKYRRVKDEKLQKLENLEKELLAEKHENRKLREMNFQLQKIVIDKFEDRFGNTFVQNYDKPNSSSTETLEHSRSILTMSNSVQPMMAEDCAQVEEGSQSNIHFKNVSMTLLASENDSSKVDCSNTSSTIDKFDACARSDNVMEEMIDIGEGVLVNSVKYGIATANEKPSMWAKEVAVCIWGSVVLGTRSVDGKPCNRLIASGAKAMPPLTPQKLNVFRCRYNEFLKKKYPVGTEDYVKHDRKFKKYIGEKISDIKKRVKRECQTNDTVNAP